MEPQEGARPEEAHSDDFRMYEYKVKQCRKSRPHDWTLCPAAHNGEKAKRRDPRRLAYTGAACPDYRKNGTCRRGDACPFAHGVFESWLHPSRYRTQCCTDGLACRRRVCFFAHQDSELRKPEDDPALLAAQLQAESIASTDSYQQILAEAAIEAGEVPPGAQGTPQLNIALLQALLRSSGMDQQKEADGSQERLRVLQLQALLATLQAAPQRAQPPGNLPGHLDIGALGRLLAANQAHVQQQAEQDILYRNSLDAARRNSFSADVNAQRQDVQYPFAGGFLDGRDSMMPGEQWSQEAAESSRRFSADASGGSGLPLDLQGMDPRILAALSSQRINSAQAAYAQAQAQHEAEQGLRRSVDMGILAHNVAMRHGSNTAGKQKAAQPGAPHPSPSFPQAPADLAALSNAFARSNLMEAQASGQLPPAGLHSKRASRDYSQMDSQASDLRRQYDALSSQSSSQLQAQLSSQLGSLGQASLGSLPLGSLGSLLGQPVSHMGSYSAQPSASQDSGSHRLSFESLSQFSPGTHSVASSGSRTRGLTEQQAQLLRRLQVEDEQERRGAEVPYSLSGGSTPSNAPPTPGRNPQQYIVPGMASSGAPYHAEPSLQNMPVQAAVAPALKAARSTPAIPEEGPAPSIADFPRSSLDAARMMPTLLEQLQVFEAQRRGSPSHDMLLARPLKRNSSFESLSADLPRSISDLSLAEHAPSGGVPSHPGRY